MVGRMWPAALFGKAETRREPVAGVATEVATAGLFCLGRRGVAVEESRTPAILGLMDFVEAPIRRALGWSRMDGILDV